MLQLLHPLLLLQLLLLQLHPLLLLQLMLQLLHPLLLLQLMLQLLLQLYLCLLLSKLAAMNFVRNFVRFLATVPTDRACSSLDFLELVDFLELQFWS